MKKLLIAFTFALLATPVFSQVKIGLQVSPGLSFNRIRDEAPNADFSPSNIGARMLAGIIADYGFQENYYFSTGLFFVPKRVGIRQEGSDELREISRLHYLQLPASLKLFTNEVALDTRIYFQVGFTLDVKILEDEIRQDADYVENFRPIDSSILLGTGAEYRIGYNTILFGGLSYRRGLVNVIASFADPNAAGLIVKNDILSLDLGIKF